MEIIFPISNRMNSRTTIITFGILVALMPFLGFPGNVKTIFFVFAGLVLAVAGYVLGSECKKCVTEETKEHNFDGNTAKQVDVKSEDISIHDNKGSSA